MLRSVIGISKARSCREGEAFPFDEPAFRLAGEQDQLPLRHGFGRRLPPPGHQGRLPKRHDLPLVVTLTSCDAAPLVANSGRWVSVPSSMAAARTGSKIRSRDISGSASQRHSTSSSSTLVNEAARCAWRCHPNLKSCLRFG